MTSNAKTSSNSPATVRLVCLLLALITVALYWPVRNFEFNNYDDEQYLTANPNVQRGLTIPAIKWAFTTGYASNWHPLTWLSHLLDVTLFGFNAGGHHFTNLLFHIANTLLLFLVLRRWTGALWRAAFVAALFAWHPLHVESVAWIAERKDVLSACFWLLTMIAYGRYVDESREAAVARSSKSRAWNYYALALGFFTLGLLAKPMLVSLPLILLLLDYWPLRRIEFPFSIRKAIPLVREKIPFFLMTVVSCVVTFIAQKEGKAVQSLENVSLADRCANAVVSYARYLGKLFWPADLAIPYPYTRDLPRMEVLGAALLLVAISVSAICLAKKRPWLLVGWFWFVISLVPVIGLVQVGEQALADRYTYIPSIGLFLAVAWEVACLFKIGSRSFAPGSEAAAGNCAISPPRRMALACLAVAVLGACFPTTARQLSYWRDSITLFSHAIEVTKNNATAENNLGTALEAKGETNEAVWHEQAALKINPDYPEAENNLAMLNRDMGKRDEAMKELLAALKSKPQYDQTHYNLGLIYLDMHRVDDAVKEFQSVIEINPQHDKARANLGSVFAQQGHLDEAMEQYKKALAIAPNNAYAHNGMGAVLESRNKTDEAAAEYAAAVELKPDFAEARENLGVMLTLRGNFPQAEEQFTEALKLKPGSASIHYNFGNALVRQNKLRAAADEYAEALRLQPEYFEANFNLALALAKLGRDAEAIEHYRAVLRLKPAPAPALQKLAWLLATDADPKLRNGAEAVRLATQATQLAPADAASWDAQGAALAETGQYSEAAAAAGKALKLASNNAELAKAIQARLQLYASGTAFREGAAKGASGAGVK